MIKGELKKYIQYSLPEPEYLMIEPTNRCNLRCNTCSRMNILEIGDMSMDSFKKILDQMQSVKIIKFHGLGEPLLAKNAILMLNHLSYLSCEVLIVTNCQWQGINIPMLLDLVDHIYISASSSNEVGYKKYTGTGNWNLLIENIKKIIHYKTEKTDVVLNFVCTKNNIDQVVDIIELASKLNISAVRYQIMQNWVEDKKTLLYQEIKKQEINDINELIEQLYNMTIRADELGIKVEIVGNEHFDYDKCVWPFRRVYITWKGDVIPCCMRPDPKFKMGNLLEEPFTKIWNSERYDCLRTSLSEKNPLPVCINCPYKALAPTMQYLKKQIKAKEDLLDQIALTLI
ncbi:MAG: SPASM domain-containing protein [bacterium]